MTHKKIAVITARGGSKRIPRKNIKLFLGVPIIKYSIDAALQSNCFDEVMVSTDDKEIADIAIALGAKVPFFRSDSISDDYASTADVLKEVIFEYKKMGANFEYLCCIYPTAPLIQINHLRNGLSQLITHNFSSIVPVVKFGYPIWRSVSIDQSGKVSMIWPKYLNTRSQDLEPVYHDAGQWYWFKVSEMGDGLFTNNTGSFVLDETEVQDIDTLSDWRIAELKYKLIYKA